MTRSSTSADQRRRILRAIGELVAKRGYADVTVELIVKRAHVSYKTFYKHFASKEECFLELFDAVFRSTERKVREQLDADDLPWAEQVALTLRTLIELIVEEPIISRAVIVETPTVGPGVLDRYERATKALVPLFRAGREHNPRGAELPATIEDTLALLSLDEGRRQTEPPALPCREAPSSAEARCEAANPFVRLHRLRP